MTEIQWQYNEETQRWEGTSQSWHAIIEPHAGLVVYVAAIEPQTDPSTLEYAPQSFETLEEAQKWCAATIHERTNLEQQIQSTLNESAQIPGA